MESVDFNGYTIYENGNIKGVKDKMLTPMIKKGRYEISLTIDGKRKSYVLARLIYSAFNPDFDINNKNMCVTFKDGNKLNVDLFNLYVEERKNLIQGDKHTISKITNELAEQIRSEWKGKACVNQYDMKDKIGMSLRELGRKYELTYCAIKMIVQNRCRDDSKYKLK